MTLQGSNRARRAALLTATALLLCRGTADAQQQVQGPSSAPSVGSGGVPSCIASIPDSVLRPAVLFVHASEVAPLDSIAGARVSEIDLFAQLVADRYRSLLHAAPDVLPAAEPTFTWRTRERGVRVVVDREGRFVARPLRDTDYPSSLGAGVPPSLLMAALDSLRADGERIAFAAGPADSVSFSLLLSDAELGPDGKLMPSPERIGFPVATLRVPRMQQVQVIKIPPPRYPERQRKDSFEASIIMEFDVDTTGHLDPAKIHDVWPSNVPPLSGFRRAAYAGFVDAVQHSLRMASFEPARIGGCPVRQRVRQPFTFGLGR